MVDIAKLQAEIEVRQARIDELVSLDDITPELDAELTDAVEAQRSAIAERDRAEARAKEVAELRGKATGFTPGVAPSFIRPVEAPAPTDVRNMNRGEARDAAMRSLEAQPDYLVADENRDHLARLIDKRTQNFDGGQIARRLLLTENDAYRSGWVKTITDPTPVFTPEEARALIAYREEQRAASLTNASGGYGVPVLIDPSIIITSAAAAAPLLSVCRRETITTNIWKGVAASGTAWSTDAEGTAVSDDTSTFTQPSITTYRGSGFIPFSFEIEQDYPGFAAEMANLIAVGYVDWLAVKTATGSGSDLQGWFTALDANSSSEVTPTTDGLFGAVDIDKVWAALPERFRSRAVWFMNVDVENEIRAFGSGTATSRFTVDQTREGISLLNGRRVILSDYAPLFTGTTGASNILIVGDPQTYMVVERAGMSIELVPHLVDVTNNRPTGQRGWFAWARAGADSIEDNGARLLQNQ